MAKPGTGRPENQTTITAAAIAVAATRVIRKPCRSSSRLGPLTSQTARPPRPSRSRGPSQWQYRRAARTAATAAPRSFHRKSVIVSELDFCRSELATQSITNSTISQITPKKTPAHIAINAASSSARPMRSTSRQANSSTPNRRVAQAASRACTSLPQCWTRSYRPRAVDATGSATPTTSTRPTTNHPARPCRAGAACSRGRLTTAMVSYFHARVAEARRGGGASPQPDAAIRIGHIVHREHRLVVDAGGHTRPTHVHAQDVPLVAMRAEQGLAEVTPLAVHVVVHPQNVVQGALFEQVERLVVPNAEGDAGVHLCPLLDRRPLLEVARLDSIRLAAEAVGRAWGQLEHAPLFA